MLIDSVIYINGVDISTHVISYRREANICTGIGTASLVTDLNLTPDPWDVVTIYEGGNKIGTYYISEEDKGLKSGTKNIKCQDASKKLQSFFVDNQHSIGSVTTTRYWITFFLEMAGADYTFTASGIGSEIAPDTIFGATSAYDIIFSLLQSSGWYIHFNSEGVCIVSHLNVGSSLHTFNDTEIIDISEITNDKMSRNSVVVWGNSDPITHTGVFKRVTQTAPWQIDGNDIRTIVLANDSIRDNTTANRLADTLLDEFIGMTHEITLKAHGFYGLDLGNKVTINSQYLSDSGFITNLITEVSNDGATTTLTIDQRCPRLVGYYTEGPGTPTVLMSHYMAANNSTIHSYTLHYTRTAITPSVTNLAYSMRGLDGFISRNQYIFTNVTTTSGGQTRGVHRVNLLTSDDDFFTGESSILWERNFAVLDDNRILVSYFVDVGTCTNDTVGDFGCVRFAILDFSTMSETKIVDLNWFNETDDQYYYWRYAVINNYLIISRWDETLGGPLLTRKFDFFVYDIDTQTLVFENLGTMEGTDHFMDFPQVAPIVVDNKAFFIYNLASAYEPTVTCPSCDDRTRIYVVNLDTQVVSLIKPIKADGSWIKIYNAVYSLGDNKIYFIADDFDFDTGIGHYSVMGMSTQTYSINTLLEVNYTEPQSNQPKYLIPSDDNVYLVKFSGLVYPMTDITNSVASIGTTTDDSNPERMVPVRLANAIDSNNYLWKLVGTFLMGYSVNGDPTQSLDTGIPTPGGTTPRQYIYVANSKIFVFNDSSSTVIADAIYEIT